MNAAKRKLAVLVASFVAAMMSALSPVTNADPATCPTGMMGSPCALPAPSGNGVQQTGGGISSSPVDVATCPGADQRVADNQAGPRVTPPAAKDAQPTATPPNTAGPRNGAPVTAP